MNSLPRLLVFSFAAALAVPLIATTTPGIAATRGAARAADSAPVHASAVPLCHGHRATIVGGPQGTTILGTPHRDIIWAGGGNDVVLGGAGRDLICGGPGSDVLNGMGGPNEPLYGGPGKDLCIAPDSEHRYHHGCEIHSLPEPPPPPQNLAGARLAAQSVTGAPLSNAARLGSSRLVGTETASTGQIYCDTNSKGGIYNPKKVSASGGYGNPSLVSVVPVRYRLTNTGWEFVGFDEEQAFDVPNDGNEYDLTMSPYSPINGLETYYIGYYFFWWTDSTQTDYDYAFGWVDYYTSPWFGTQNVGVCQPN